MKTRCSKLVPILPVLCLAGSAASLPASAQTPAQLSIQTYAGLTITGAVGSVYSIECVTDLARTNDQSAWRCLEFLRLPASPYLWADKSAPATANRFYRAMAMEAPANMVFIPPGTFMMGSPTNEADRDQDEGPQTAIMITRGFWMQKYEVTQGEYQAVIGNNPSLFAGDLNRPVEGVDWFDATNYCGRLTQQQREGGKVKSGAVYRLPTEAEWEYACRAWTSTSFSYGEDPEYTNLANFAWFDRNSSGTTHPVGEKLPNPWGLYDMFGNVSEWCQDWYGSYPGGLLPDPQGPGSSTTHERAIRGGNYAANDDEFGRSANRGFDTPGSNGPRVGFRVVLAADQP